MLFSNIHLIQLNIFVSLVSTDVSSFFSEFFFIQNYSSVAAIIWRIKNRFRDNFIKQIKMWMMGRLVFMGCVAYFFFGWFFF